MESPTPHQTDPFRPDPPPRRFLLPVVGAAMLGGIAWQVLAAEMPNACPVDGCEVNIVDVKKSADELELTLDANYTPDNARNHLHMWWGEQYIPQQVGRNAKNEYNVDQGKWHRHDDYPVYVTSGAASTGIRDGAVTLCVTAADRDHNVIDADVFHCMDVADYLT